MTDKILVPIDYTEVACNAIRYALAAYPKASYTILHINDRSLDTGYGTISGSKAEMKELTQFVCKCMDVRQLPDNITVVARYGTVVPTMREYMSQQEFDFIIMGTRDKYDLLDNWFGTISLGMVKSTSVPIYLVPKYAKYEQYKKVIVATDKHLNDRSFIRIIKNWNSEFNAFIKFLHVQESATDDFDDVERKIVSELFEEQDVSFGFEIERVKGRSISDSLLATAYNYGADLMIVLPDNQSYVDSLLFQSLSKQLILKSDIPLLFIHKNNFVY